MVDQNGIPVLPGIFEQSEEGRLIKDNLELIRRSWKKAGIPSQPGNTSLFTRQ